MKEERKEKNRKSHTGSVSWSTGLLRYRKPAASTAYNPGCHTALCGQGGRGGLPRGARVCQRPQCPPNAAPRPGEWMGHPSIRPDHCTCACLCGVERSSPAKPNLARRWAGI